MLRPRGTLLPCIRPLTQHPHSKHILPRLAIACRPFHAAIVPRQSNEPHGPDMNDLPKVAIVNPADKYKQDGEKLHEYGTYLMACLPKFIQKFRYLPHLRIQLMKVCGRTSWR
jgi:hypothetical protein